MIIEWLRHATTPCPRPLREMGYLREAIALQARHRRCRRAWRPHLEACEDLIRAAMAACGANRRAVVLGSGLLLDIPLKDLSRAFEEVLLVDLIHLPEAGAQARRCRNVRLVNRDVTGVVARVHAWSGNSGGGLPPVPPADLPIDGADLVISASLLSQLPLLPVDRLSLRGCEDEAALNSFGRHIVEAHLTGLRAAPGIACLITEEAREIHDGARLVDTENPLWGVALPPPDRRWPWDIAPRPEIAPEHDVRYAMAGYVDIRRA